MWKRWTWPPIPEALSLVPHSGCQFLQVWCQCLMHAAWCSCIVVWYGMVIWCGMVCTLCGYLMWWFGVDSFVWLFDVVIWWLTQCSVAGLQAWLPLTTLWTLKNGLILATFQKKLKQGWKVGWTENEAKTISLLMWLTIYVVILWAGEQNKTFSDITLAGPAPKR